MSMFDTSPRRRRAGAGQTSGAKGQYDRMYIGWVMDNTDAQRMGRLRVYIPEFGGDPHNEDNWVVASYCSPFAGATNAWASDAQAINSKVGEGQNKRKQGNVQDGRKFEETQQSYGMWFVPPDINNEVLVGFAAGDPTKGIWFGCLYQQHMNHMIPGIAKGSSYQKSGCLDKNGNPVQDPPVSEYNRMVSNPAGASSETVRRPEFKPLNLGLTLQGLSCDTLRGVSTSSARRESPSEVFGILTPKGSQFVMDDKDGEELIRLRTKSGTQMLLSESDGHVYFISRDGDSWFELNSDGHVDVYGAASVSIHGEAHINLRADQDVNIESGGNLNLKAKGYIRMESGGNTDITAGADLRANALASVAINAAKDQTLAAGGQIGVKAGGELRQVGAAIHLNGPEVPDAAAAEKPEVHPLSGNKKVRSSVTTRVPEHEPWKPHTVTLGETSMVADPSPPPGSASSADPEEASDSATPQEPLPEVPPGECAELAKLRMSERGKLMILDNEAFFSYAYPDSSGYWTIGYGHHKGMSYSQMVAKWPNGVTEDEAWKIFSDDVAEFEEIVKKKVRVCLTQQQFDACVDLTFNMGTFPNDMANLINAKNYEAAGLEFMKYVYSKKVKQKGLVARREKDRDLFLKNVYPASVTRETHKNRHLKEVERRYPRNLRHASRDNVDVQARMAASAYQRMTGKSLGGGGSAGV